VQQTDGTSFLPVLKGDAHNTKERLLVWHYPHRWTRGEGPGLHFFSAARKGDWKLIYDQRKQQLYLYDLKKDIGEEHDVAAENPTVTRRLAEELTKYLKERNVVMPVIKSTGRRVSWPDESVK
jgi:arylsulfatase A-like enzyme